MGSGAGVLDRPTASRAGAPAPARRPAAPAPAARRPWRVWPGAAGLAAIAALVPAAGLWPARAALLALVLTVPGLLLLGALRVPVAATLRTPVYVVGASLAVVTASGLAVDLLGPPLGVAQPLRAVPLLVGLEAVGLVLLAASAWARPRPGRPGWRAAAVPVRRLWPLALPLAAAAGAALLTGGHGPGLAIGVVAAELVALAAAVVLAPRMSASQLGLVLYGVGLGLAWAYTMRGGSVYGFDITAEYQVMRSTGLAGLWETAHTDDAYGAMLSLTVLPASLHELTGISELVLLKAVYPALFALFPVAVFLVARRFLSPRYAVAAGAFIVVQSYFFQQIPAIARQEIALLAFAIAVAAAVDRRLPRGPRMALAATMGLLLVVSHYTTTYLAIAILACAVVLQLAVSTFRPAPRVSGAVVAALLVTAAGAALWYGPVTGSSSNLADFQERVAARGLQPLPNREPGQGILQSYLQGNTTSAVGAAEYQELAAEDYAKNRPFVIPLPAAEQPRYDLRDSRPAAGQAAAPRVAGALDGAELVIQQAANALAALGALVLALRRRTPPFLRTVALLGLGTLAVLAAIRLSGTAANAYNQERAFLQALVPLAVGLAWIAQAGAGRLGRLRPLAGAAVALVLATILVNTSGLAGATVGTGAGGNLAAEGEDHERFLITEPELAGAAWFGAQVPDDAVVYADRYGQLRLFAAVGQPPRLMLDVTPRTLDQHAWVYASRTNVVDGRARSQNSGRSAVYAFPARFLGDHYDRVYDNGESRVHRR